MIAPVVPIKENMRLTYFEAQYYQIFNNEMVNLTYKHINNKFMCINRSEQFLYFQNKTKHYDNLKNAKPIISDKHSRQTLARSLSHYDKRYIKNFEISLENEKLMNRLIDISTSKRTEVSAQGDYSRYHLVKRQFRNKNPHQLKNIKRIDIENEQMNNRIDNAQAKIGRNQEWVNDYQKILNHRKNLSRFDEKKKSKRYLHISSQRFIPEHYKHLLSVKSSPNRNSNQTTIPISAESLISLPKITKRNKSRSGNDEINKTMDL